MELREKTAWGITAGLFFSMVIMNILNMGMPTTDTDGKPIPEWVQVTYNILTAGWGNFTVITAVSVLAFGASPWAFSYAFFKQESLFPLLFMGFLGGFLAHALSLMLPDMLAFVLACVLVVVLTSLLQELGTALKRGFIAAIKKPAQSQ